MERGRRNKGDEEEAKKKRNNNKGFPLHPLHHPSHNNILQYYEGEGEEERGGCGWWWDPNPDRNFSQYCNQTSIHGLKYLVEPRRHLFERLFWVIGFGVSLLASSYLIQSVWIKYRDSPVVVTFQPYETFIEQLPFPAVTICNMNKVLKTKANHYMSLAQGDPRDPLTLEARKEVFYLDHVCSSSNKPFSTTFNYSSTQGTVSPAVLNLAISDISWKDEGVENVAHFLHRASQPCVDMLKLCMWQGEAVPCDDLFRPIETNFGKCCTFNMIPQTLLHRYKNDSRDSAEVLDEWSEWNVAKDGLILPSESKGLRVGKYPRRQKRAGKSSGLSFLVNPDLDQYFCTSSDSIGFRLATHLTTDVPHVTDFGLGIKPNQEHFISVRPEVTLADDIIEEYAIEKRNCYVEDEFSLKYFAYYSSSNCFDECIANLTFERCNCVRYYMPRDNERDICNPANFSCAQEVKQYSLQAGVKSLCTKCRPSCTEVRYYAESSASPFRRRVDLWVDDRNRSTSWAKNNISIIHVYFGQDSTYARVRGQLYGITDLIANFGGLMGLCMGFSGLSLIEIIYFFSLRVFCRRRRRKGREEGMKLRDKKRTTQLRIVKEEEEEGGVVRGGNYTRNGCSSSSSDDSGMVIIRVVGSDSANNSSKDSSTMEEHHHPPQQLHYYSSSSKL